MAKIADKHAFDSFSYVSDSIFSQKAVQIVEPVFEPMRNELPKITQPASISNIEDHTAEKTSARAPNSIISQAEYFDLQLALDKASSRAMILGVEYQNLLKKIQRLEKAQKSGGTMGLFSSSDAQDFAALKQQNLKALAEKDKQIEVLETKLRAGQVRYADENVKRLLAEKNMGLLKDKSKKAQQISDNYNIKLRILNDQLQQNKDVIDQLGIALTREKLKNAQVKTLTSDMSTPVSDIDPAENEHEPLAPEITGPPALSSLSPTNEWQIQGLAFEEASAKIKSTGLKSIDDLLAFLSSNGQNHIQVNAYTDSEGSAENNQQLSQSRAEAVAAHLVERGLEPFRVSAHGFGERRPIASNQTELGRIKNRRVSVFIFK